ncbi:hypothetical protein HDV01_004938, partial [Terramyces sp. JEL0728]
RPDKWRLGQLLTLSFILGALLMGISFAHFFFAKSQYPFNSTEDYNYKYVQTIMYLQISSCPHFVIFSTRLGSWWWKSMPSWTFLIAIIGTQIVAGIITLIGPEIFEAVPIGPAWTFGVLGVSLLMFMLLDIVKVYTFKVWSFDLVSKLWPTAAHKAKLEKKSLRRVQLARFAQTVNKVKKVAHAINAANAFVNAKNFKKEQAVIAVVGN